MKTGRERGDWEAKLQVTGVTTRVTRTLMAKIRILSSFQKQSSAGAFLLLCGFSAAKLQGGHFSHGFNQGRERVVRSKLESEGGWPVYQLQE